MNDKQRRFCQNVVAGMTAYKAYIAAGYVDSGSARRSASRLMTFDYINEELARLRQPREEVVMDTCAWLIEQQKALAEMAIEKGDLSTAKACFAEVAKLTGSYTPVQTEATIKGQVAVDATQASSTDWAALREATRQADAVRH